MSVMSLLQPSPTAPQVRPREAASDLDAVRSSGWLDSAAASYEVGKDEVPAVQDSRLLQAYIPVRRAVAEAMGKSPVFGYFSAANTALGLLPFTSNDTTDKDALWEDIQTLRRQGKLPAGIPTDRAKFENEILTRGGQRTVDQMKAAQGTFTSRVVGGIGASFNDPVQVGVALATGGASRGMSVSRSILVEGLLNAGAAAVEMPMTVQARAALGEATTASDVVAELGTAFAFGAAADLGMRGLSAGWSAGKSALAIPERTNPIKVAQAFAKAVPEAMRTPEQQAALHVIEREASLAESAPKGASAPEVNAHLARLDAAQRALVEEGKQAGARGFARAVAVQDGREAQAAFKAQAAVAESGGNDLAKAATSSAYGRYQFIKSTWESYYVRRFGRQGLTAEQIAAKRADPALQEQLMDDLTADNAAQLRKIGAPVTKANLYLAHLLGPRDADKVLRAAPDTPLEGLISARSIAANKSFMAGRKVADIIAFSERKMKAAPGTGGGAGMAPEPFEGTMADVVPPERAAALTAERPDVPSAEAVTLAPQIEALVPQLRTLVQDKASKLNDIDALAQQFDVSPDDIRAGFDVLVRKGELAQRKDNGAFTRSRPPAREQSLVEWIKQGGGIWDGDGTTFKGGDFAAMGLNDWYKGGPFRDKNPIIRSDDFARQNRGADKIMRAAVEAGYFPELRAALDSNGPDSIDTNLLLQAIDEELRGRPRYPIGTSGFEKQMKLRPDKDWQPEPDEVPNSTEGRSFEEAIGQFSDYAQEMLWFHGTWLGTSIDRLDPWILDRTHYVWHEQIVKSNDVTKSFERAINDYAEKTATDALKATGDRQYGDISYEWPTYHDPRPGGEGSAAEADSAGYAPAGGAEGAGEPRGADPAGDRRQAIDGPLPDAVAERFSDPAGPEAKAQAASFTHDLKAAVERPTDIQVANANGEMTPQWEQHLTDAEARAAEIKAAGQTPLFHATAGTWKAENPNGLGMMFWAEDVMMAERYAGAGGGARAGGGKGRIMVRGITDQTKLLDITTPEGVAVLASLPKKGRMSGYIINDAERELAGGAATASNAMWTNTKRATGSDAAGIRQHIVDELRSQGYAGIRFMDDRHPTVALFEEAPAATLDAGAAIDPNIAARTRQEADIAAQQPLDGARKTGVAQDPVMPEGLFGGPVEPPLALFNDVMFETGGLVPETVAQALARLDDDDAALAAMRGCL